ncbi:MAG: 6-carboxyhexanoate--CoA ligase [Firmicutes bacterium]|nr:6-carboxyhexanoate--CoA ligase [Bacillota bacterium]
MQNLYSIRMRAARGGAHEDGGRHISGAERIVPKDKIPAVLQQLYSRAEKHQLGRPDFINITVESLSGREVNRVTSLPVYTLGCRDYPEGRRLAVKVLELKGIPPRVIEKGFSCLLGDSPSGTGENMRGAILLDINTGRRLEADPGRGVRASRMDYHPDVTPDLSEQLDEFGLNNDHVREALCLATKVANLPGIVAELCWSDDPGYTAGYVAAADTGYIRFPHLKARGNRRGGRIFFVDPGRAKPKDIIGKLEQKIYIITALGPVHGEITLEELKRSIRLNEIHQRRTVLS